MYPHHTGYVGQNKPERYSGGYDTFSRVFGRPQEYPQPAPHWSIHGLQRGYDLNAPASSPRPLNSSPATYSTVHPPVPGDVIHEEPVPVKYGERTVKKLVHVPVTHEVKVPTTIEKVVHTTEIKEIPITKVVQEPAYKTVQEEYVDYEEREATRMKEVWVRQEVPEKYTERVPVKKVRTVEVPYTTTRQLNDVHRVEVPVTKVVQEPGYRVDHVVEYQTHEVEGKQRVEWIPRIVDDPTDHRDLGLRDRHVVDRKLGNAVYPENRAPGSPGPVYHPPASSLPLMHSPLPPYSPPPPAANNSGDAFFGLYVRESVMGLVVKGVVPGSSASLAGMEPFDIINTIDDEEVYSIDDWRRTTARKSSVVAAYRSKRLGKPMKALLNR